MIKNKKSSNTENYLDEVKEDTIQKVKKFRKENGLLGDVLIITVIITIVYFATKYCFDLTRAGVTNFNLSFNEASEVAREESYESYYADAYQKAYDKAIKENKITNTAYISISNIQEMSKYEVLTVLEDATVVESEEQKKQGIYAWTRFKGKGVFTVDLEQSEILVDHANYYVSVKIPHPKLSYVPLTDETEKMFYLDTRKDYFFFPKKDTKTGIDIYIQQKSLANEKIYNSIKKNNSYYEKASEAAINSLTNLVKSLNPDISDKLNIEIAFND